MPVINITEKNFHNEVVKTVAPAILYFYASWCGPCQTMNPLSEELTQKYPELKICKINVDANPIITDRFNVMNVPTVVFMRYGETQKQFVGIVDIKELYNLIDTYR